MTLLVKFSQIPAICGRLVWDFELNAQIEIKWLQMWIESLPRQADDKRGFVILEELPPTLYPLITHWEHLCGITKMMGARANIWELKEML